MTKLITKKWGLLFALIAILVCCSEQNLFAQCNPGETGVDIIVDTTVGSFDAEIGWALVDDQNNVVASLDCDGIAANDSDVILIESVCLTIGDVYTFLAFDDFGDGWNSNTVQIVGNINGTFEGCDYVATFSPVGGDDAVPDLGDANDVCFTDTSPADQEASIPFTAGVFDNIALTDAVLSGAVCTLTNSETLTISVENIGCSEEVIAGNAEVTVTLIDPNGTQGPIVEALPVIAEEGTIDFVLVNTFDLSAFGDYTMDISVDFTVASGIVDVDQSDNTASFSFATQAPLTDPFENYETFVAGTATDGVFSGGWTTASTSAYVWEVEDATGANENSSGTGPFFDHTTGTVDGIYMYTEATSGATGDVAVLVSPCIDLGAYLCPKVEFWYHMFGPGMGELHVDINDGSGWTLDVAPPIVGQQQATGDAAWLQASGNIGDYAGQIVQIRFRGIKGASFESDMSIDDFNIVDDLSDNIAITNVSTSSDGCNTSDSETVSITVSNLSCNDIPAGSVDVTYEITSGPTTAGPFTETISDAIPANTSVTHTFATLTDLSMSGAYALDFAADFNAGSGLTDSDLSNNAITGAGISTFDFFGNIDGNTDAYMESFEADNGGWVTVDVGGNSTIGLGTPPAGQTNINAASDGTMAWFSGGSTTAPATVGEFYNASELIFFQTGCFDMSCMETATFSIDVNFDTEAAWDGASIGYNTDGGTTFSILGIDDGAGTGTSDGTAVNWYNDGDVDGIANEIDGWSGSSAGWLSATHDISFLAGFSNVRFAVIFGSDGSGQPGEGFAFDNVSVTGDTTDPSCLGCTTDPGACNYDPEAIYEDASSCEYLTCAGCTDMGACNYDAAATIEDNSSCDYSCLGCTDMTACNYDATATIDDGSCIIGICGDGVCDVVCGEDVNGCVDCLSSVLGCTDMTACNFNSAATVDDGSCEYLTCAGCTDMTACNFNALATLDDGSCVFGSCGNGICETICGETVSNCTDCATRFGCTDITAHNYSPRATDDDGSCETCADGIMNGDEVGIDCGGALCGPCSGGCMDVTAHNYDAMAVVDNGSCETCVDGIMNGDETGLDCGGALCGPCGDLCINALDIACGGTVMGDTNNNTGDDVPANCGGVNNPNAGAWYSFIGTGENVVLSTDNAGTSGFDTNLQVFEGICGALTCVDGDEDGGSIYTNGWTSELTVTTTPGAEYYVYVGGYSGGQGAYEMTMDCFFPLNIAVDAVKSIPTNGVGTGSIGVTVTGGNTDCGPLTYAWTGPGGYTASTADIADITMVGVYTLTVEDCLGNVESVAVNVAAQTRGHGRGRKAGEIVTSQLQAAPNPFANATTISFELNTEERVSLDVFDIRGAKVATLFDGTTEVGQNYQVQFGEAMPSGTYIAKLTTANGQIQHIKLFLTK